MFAANPLFSSRVAALIACLLLAGAPAFAQTKAPAPAPASSPPPSAQSAPVAAPASGLFRPGNLEVGGEAGLAIPFTSGYGLGLKFAGQAFSRVSELAPGISLLLGGQVAFDVHPFGDFTLWFFDVLPTGRVRFTQLVPGFTFYGEAGAGLGLVHVGFADARFNSYSDTSVAFLIKLGGGIEFKINELMTVTAGPALNFYLRSGGFTELTLMGGFLYKI